MSRETNVCEMESGEEFGMKVYFDNFAKKIF